MIKRSKLNDQFLARAHSTLSLISDNLKRRYPEDCCAELRLILKDYSSFEYVMDLSWCTIPLDHKRRIVVMLEDINWALNRRSWDAIFPKKHKGEFLPLRSDLMEHARQNSTIHQLLLTDIYNRFPPTMRKFLPPLSYQGRLTHDPRHKGPSPTT